VTRSQKDAKKLVRGESRKTTKKRGDDNRPQPTRDMGGISRET